MYFQRELKVLQNAKFSTQEAELYPILALANMRRCCIDATGIGAQFAERAQERFGKYRIEAVHFTNAVKADMAYKLRAAFEDRNVRIADNRDIRADFRSIKREVTVAGAIRFDAERTESLGHGDRFWGAALGFYAGTNPKESYLQPVQLERNARFI